MDPQNRNKVEHNISEEEKTALKELVKLQRERVIVIRPCDKGAGIIILDFVEYIEACDRHLASQTKLANSIIPKLIPQYCKQHMIK